MRKGRRARRGPDLEYGLVVAVAILISAAAVVLLLRDPDHQASDQAAPTSSAIGASSPVIGDRPIPTPTEGGQTAADVAAARHVARRFLSSYLPVLYGHRPVSTILDADAHVRAELDAAAHTSTAPRDRTPRITQLSARAQADASVVVIALIADGVQPAYQVVCQLTTVAGHWRVSELANY